MHPRPPSHTTDASGGNAAAPSGAWRPAFHLQPASVAKSVRNPGRPKPAPPEAQLPRGRRERHGSSRRLPRHRRRAGWRVGSGGPVSAPGGENRLDPRRSTTARAIAGMARTPAVAPCAAGAPLPRRPSIPGALRRLAGHQIAQAELAAGVALEAGAEVVVEGEAGGRAADGFAEVDGGGGTGAGEVEELDLGFEGAAAVAEGERGVGEAGGPDTGEGGAVARGEGFAVAGEERRDLGAGDGGRRAGGRGAVAPAGTGRTAGDQERGGEEGEGDAAAGRIGRGCLQESGPGPRSGAGRRRKKPARVAKTRRMPRARRGSSQLARSTKAARRPRKIHGW